MNKIHVEDATNTRRTICHTYRTERRQVITSTDPAKVTCTRCLAKLAKQSA